jgi:hypothetical protein
VTDAAAPEVRPERRAVPGDSEYADGYAQGYEDGIREALKEVLQHAARGHTVAELRLLIESRLARLPDDVQLKLKGLLSPPRRPAWGPLLRAPTPPPATAVAPSPLPVPTPSVEILEPRTTALVLEERPNRALEILRASLARFPKLVLVTAQPPELPAGSGDRVQLLHVASPEPGGDPSRGALSPNVLAGRLRGSIDSPEGALVYLDAVEFLATEYSVETTIKLVYWLTGQVAASPASALLVSVDPGTFADRELQRLKRSFHKLL